jgi:hypothetical protein
METASPTIKIPSSAEPIPPAGWRTWIGTGVLLVFLAMLFASEIWRSPGGGAASAPLQPAAGASWSAATLIRLELARCFVSLLLGFLVPLGLFPLTRRFTGWWKVFAWFSWLAASWAAVALWMRLGWGHLPSANALLVPWGIAAVGVVVGAAATAGWKQLLVAFGGLMLTAGLVIGGGWLGLRAVLSEEPLGFERVRFDTTEKNLLVTRIRETRPAPDEPRILRLREDELTGLLNSQLLRLGSQHKARLQLAEGEATAEISLAGPGKWEKRFVNIELGGSARVVDGRVTATVEMARIGGIPLPWPATSLLAGSLETFANDEPTVRLLLDVVSNTEVRVGEVEFLFDAGRVGQDILPSLIEQVWGGPNVAPETQVYAARLLEVVRDVPASEDRLGLLMQEAFRLARERSATGDPQLENRAAIFGLAIVLGHDGIEQLVGNVLTPEQRKQLPKVIGTAKLRGRQDWARHFLVSAATELLADRITGDTMGVFKESIDAQAGGSGFSFADLLANMSGMRFAALATQTEQSARAVQAGLAIGFDVDAIFPYAADLPEGIAAGEFEQNYGGVEGSGYARMVRELQYRLQEMPSIGR